MTEDTPLHFELKESSGPVSPRYQYILNQTLEAGPAKITVAWDCSGQAAPLSPLQGSRMLSKERYLHFWQVFQSRGASLTAALEGHPRVGVSYNSFEIKQLPDGELVASFGYTLSGLEDEANAGWREAIEAFKQLAQEV